MSNDDDGGIPLACPRDFSLNMASKFVKDFPAAQGGGDGPTLDLAFPIEGSWQQVGVRVQQSVRRLQASILHNGAAASGPRVQSEVERILNLHTDHLGDLEGIGRRDPIAGALIRHFHGLRPVQFHTPYEAAVWAVLSQRVRTGQAATIKRGIARAFGTRMEFPGGTDLWCFPAPRQLLTLRTFPGLTPRKMHHLHEVAHATLDRKLDSASLLRLPSSEALSVLESIAGVGPFSAELILVRGAGHPDHFPLQERRLHQAMQTLYGITGVGQLETIAGNWKPLRSWIAFLVRAWQEAGCPELATLPSSASGVVGVRG